jgi:putative intracellular protease/amidase
MATIIIPIPSQDFDPTEAAVPWVMLSKAGHIVHFATPDGKPGAADDIMITGEGLDLWGFIPGLKKFVLFGRMLRANASARRAYAAMIVSPEFRAPIQWDAARAENYDGLILPGGHRARGMRAYLESEVLQNLVFSFFRADKPVGAICHGVLLAARAVDPLTGQSVLNGRKTTSLTWALERSGTAFGRVVRFWDPTYYRTYTEAAGQPPGTMSVQAEVIRALGNPADYLDVPTDDPHYRRKTSGLARDSEEDTTPAFVVRDGNYISARWPGDAHGFAKAFAGLLRYPVE